MIKRRLRLMLALGAGAGLAVGITGNAFAQDVDPAIAELAVAMDTMWLLLAAFLVFFMQAGFALVEAGSTRSKNMINIMMKNLMDFCIAALVFWMVGWGFAYGTSAGGLIGTDQFFLGGESEGGVPPLASWVFHQIQRLHHLQLRPLADHLPGRGPLGLERCRLAERLRRLDHRRLRLHGLRRQHDRPQRRRLGRAHRRLAARAAHR
jgi:hypothetical protein